MLTRILFFLIGFGLTVVGLVHIILFLNYLTIGYTFGEYVNFIIRQLECYYTLIGITIMLICVYIPGGKNNELYL